MPTFQSAFPGAKRHAVLLPTTQHHHSEIRMRRTDAAMEMTPLVYVLHSGNLYGTERMALATAEGLASEYSPVIFAPPGPAVEEARRLGFQAHSFSRPQELAFALRPWIAGSKRLAFLATGVVHSMALIAWNLLYRRKVAHLHLVHGGTDERLSYGRKRRLNGRRVRFVAVSSFVRERLCANGVTASQISVIENFLPESRLRTPRRARFQTPGIRRAVVISRIDPIKRVDLLLDAIESEPALRRIEFRIFGTGWQLEELRARAARSCPRVEFAGFRADVDRELAEADLLVHLCPAEPFGLAILEAMAAGVPVLAPNSGGAGSLIDDGASGFHFAANNARALADRILALDGAAPELLNRAVDGGLAALAGRFSARERLDDYRRLIEAELA